MPIDFEKKRKQRQETDQKADELISYVRKNCTQSTEMLKFLDQPALKKEISTRCSENALLSVSWVRQVILRYISRPSISKAIH